MRKPRLAAWIAALILAGSTAARGEDPAAPAGYIGQLYLYRFERVVVVYPVGPGENAAENRRSALARARFLEKTHGVKTSVVADDAVGKAERAENLLLLGWGNRALTAAGVASPFRRTASGMIFLGETESDSSLDLMFFGDSPFAEGKAIVFWSRIDADRDRMMVLPAVGSDWALFKDFATVRQGMFRRPSTWPPARNIEAERDARPERLAAESRQRRKESARFDLFYDPAAVTDQDADAILRAREAALTAAAGVLGPVPKGFRIRLAVYKDEQEKKERTGIDSPAHSVPGSRELHMLPRMARSSSPHEEIHLLAGEVLGPCRLTTMYEGLALSVDGSYKGTDLAVHAASMLAEGALPPLRSLLDEEEARSLPLDARFASAGLLLSWIRETAGPSGLARVYRIGEGTVEALARALVQPAAALPGAFATWIGVQASSRASDLAFSKALKEAEGRLRLGDYAGVAQAVRRALQIRPEDPQSLFNLASAEMRTGEYADAEAQLRRLLSLELSDKESRFVVFGHYQLGRVLDLQGKRKEALAAYGEVMKLPDQHDSHRLAREAIERAVTPKDLE